MFKNVRLYRTTLDRLAKYIQQTQKGTFLSPSRDKRLSTQPLSPKTAVDSMPLSGKNNKTCPSQPCLDTQLLVHPLLECSTSLYPKFTSTIHHPQVLCRVSSAMSISSVQLSDFVANKNSGLRLKSPRSMVYVDFNRSNSKLQDRCDTS